jgi:hypothetical protein
MLTNHLHLLPRLIISEVLPPPPADAFVASRSTTFTLTVTFTKKKALYAFETSVSTQIATLSHPKRLKQSTLFASGIYATSSVRIQTGARHFLLSKTSRPAVGVTQLVPELLPGSKAVEE